MAGVEFRVLGPLEVVGATGVIPLGGAKQRSVLAMLLLDANQVVSVDRLVEGVWGDDAHQRAPATLQVYVSNLRKLLEPEPGAAHQVLLSRKPGYLLRVEPESLDLLRFEALAEDGRQRLTGGHVAEAAPLLAEALALWRGPALADLTFEPFAAQEVERLGQARLDAVEDRIEADLALGRHTLVVGELEALVVEQPLRERLWSQLMLALYGSGRQADALRAYSRARETLVEELGIDPGPALRELEGRILAQDPGLSASPPGGRRRVRLPTPASSLVGRRHERKAAVERLLEPGVRLLTLTGPGGTGKTRLALEVAGAVEDAFPGGMTFVPLAAVSDPDLVMPAVAQALDVREEPGRRPVDLVAEALGGPEALLVLDNLEQVLGVGPAVADLLASAPALTVLATSRVGLRISAEHEHPVPPLALPDSAQLADAAHLEQYEAVELFLARGRAVVPDFTLTDANARAVAEICVRLDGLPLALELAAARVKVLRPEDLLDRLDRSLALLVGGSRDLPDRQRTLRATLDWSYGLLDPPEQQLLARLSVFVGTFTLEAAEAVCGPGPDEPDVLDSLGALVANSLVGRAHEGVELRFRLLQTVRDYAVEQLERSGEAEDRRRRHARQMLDAAEAAQPRLDGPEAPLLLDQLRGDEANCRAAFGWALAHDGAELAGRLAVALRLYWLGQGYFGEGRSWLGQVLAAPSLPERIRAQATVAAGILAYYQDDRAEAEVLLTEGRDRCGAMGDAEGTAAAVCFLGASLVADGEPDRARPLAEEALAVARAEGFYETHVLSLSLTAMIAALAGDETEEKRRYEERLALVRARGDRGRIADTLDTLAEIALDEGRPDQARSWGEEALALADGSRMVTRDTLLTLGRVALADRAAERAVESFKEALSISVELGQPFETAQCLRALGAAAVLGGEDRRAARLFGAAETCHPQPGEEGPPLARDIEELVRAGRQRLGPDAFATAWGEGAALPADEAAALGLEEVVGGGP